MAKFRKKPIIIEAMRFDGSFDSRDEIVKWANIDYVKSMTLGHREHHAGINIDTLEGTLTVSPDDWVIKGIAGEFYPCKPSIFEATYEAVE